MGAENAEERVKAKVCNIWGKKKDSQDLDRSSAPLCWLPIKNGGQ